MAYLNSTSVVIDAILTKKGRELLARNDGSFRITQFSLADDEIDYSLYNPNHPSGSAFYGEAIQAMPVIQAYPDDQEILKYKLITLPRGTGAIPVISSVPNIDLVLGRSITVNPQTANYVGSASPTETSGYLFIIGDVRTMSSFNGIGINTAEATTLNNTTTTIGTNVSKTVIGTSLNMTATTVRSLFGSATQINTTLTVVGRDSGARISVPVKITLS